MALYFSNNPRLPDDVQRRTAELQQLHGCGSSASRPTGTDVRTVVDELGQAWQRYDAMEGTLYLIRPDGYVMGRWREAASAHIDIDRVLERTLKDLP